MRDDDPRQRVWQAKAPGRLETPQSRQRADSASAAKVLSAPRHTAEKPTVFKTAPSSTRRRGACGLPIRPPPSRRTKTREGRGKPARTTRPLRPSTVRTMSENKSRSGAVWRTSSLSLDTPSNTITHTARPNSSVRPHRCGLAKNTHSTAFVVRYCIYVPMTCDYRCVALAPAFPKEKRRTVIHTQSSAHVSDACWSVCERIREIKWCLWFLPLSSPERRLKG